MRGMNMNKIIIAMILATMAGSAVAGDQRATDTRKDAQGVKQEVKKDAQDVKPEVKKDAQDVKQGVKQDARNIKKNDATK
jgi:ABC-type transporter MlaC component